MAKKNDKTQSGEAQTNTKSTGTVIHTKSIKNSLFKDLEIGSGVIVGGIIRSLTDKSGNFGDFTEFKGDFGCVVGSDTYRGTKLFLPSVAADTLKNQFLDALENLPEGQDATKLKIEFKIKLVKTPDDSPKNNSKFVWTFENLNETRPEQDRILSLLN